MKSSSQLLKFLLIICMLVGFVLHADAARAAGFVMDRLTGSHPSTSEGLNTAKVQAPGSTSTLSDVTCYPIYDFGDLPDTYATVLNSDGPRHLVGGGLTLGKYVDMEMDGLPNATATGDDTDGVQNDEDGISPVAGEHWTPGATVHVQVTVNGCASGNCQLNTWMDWNNDGTFAQPGDQMLNDYSISNGDGQSLAVTIPDSYVTGTPLNARFRLCSSAGNCNTTTGPAQDGEVEDYHWNFTPTTVTLASFRAAAAGSHLPLGALPAAAAILVGGFWITRRRR